MTKEIPVMGSARPALVDDEDYEWAKRFEWFEEDGFILRWCQPGEMGLADDPRVIEMGTEVWCRHTGRSISEFRKPRNRRHG
jgi:hypothetical protein